MRGLLVLVPWMAMAAAATAGEAPASLVFGHRETPFRNLVRDGDALFAPESVVRQLGWTIRLDEAEADLDAEGRRVRVAVRRRAGAPWIELGDAFRQLGAHQTWSEDGRTLLVAGRLRRLAIEGGRLRVDSTLPLQLRTSRLAQPERLVLDLAGAMLPSDLPFRLPEGVRAGQFRPNVVRVVVEGEGVHRATVPDLSPTRFLDVPIPLRGGNPTEDAPPARGGAEGTAPPAVSTTNPTVDLPPTIEPLDPVEADPASNPEGLVNANEPPADTPPGDPAVPEDPPAAGPPGPGRLGVPTFAAEPADSPALSFPVAGASASPAARYLDPLRFEVDFPGVGAVEPVAWTANPWVRSVQTRVAGGRASAVVEFARPTGFTLSAVPGRVVLRLSRPRGQDGRLAGKVIVLDPGHGGADPGARSPDGRVQEKDLTLAVGRLAARYLAAEGAAVILTRNDDRRIPLRERAEIANRSNAAAFVSIHFNSNRIANSRSGSMTFFHRQDPMGKLLAECLHRPIVRAMGLPDLKTLSDTRIYDTGFGVLRHARMPGVLLEPGFINHATDRRRMTDPAVQDRLARAIVEGLRTFFGDAPTKSETPIPE